MTIKYQMFSILEDAFVVQFGEEFSQETTKTMYHVAKKIQSEAFPWLIEIVPSFTTLTIYYDAKKIPSPNPEIQAQQRIHEIINKMEANDFEQEKKVRIPVCYHPEMAPDLITIAKNNDLSINEVIELHTDEKYFVSYLGFSLQIPFIGGINPNISVQKKLTQKIHIPLGSVGINESKTGIYPLKTTGDWQIIGRVPSKILKTIFSVCKPGDEVEFVSIPLDTFYALEQNVGSWEFTY